MVSVDRLVRLEPDQTRGADGSIRRRGAREKITQLARVFPNREIVAALSRQLVWCHFVELLPLDDPLKWDFYGEMCRRWRSGTRRKRARSPRSG